MSRWWKWWAALTGPGPHRSLASAVAGLGCIFAIGLAGVLAIGAARGAFTPLRSPAPTPAPVVTFVDASPVLVPARTQTPPPTATSTPLAVVPPDGVPRGAVRATVVEVRDAETIVVQLNRSSMTVRLLGIDAPQPNERRHPGACLVDEAVAAVTRLLPVGREVWLEADQLNFDEQMTFPRYVWVQKRDGQVYLLNLVLVRDGYAVVSPRAPDSRWDDRLRETEAGAKRRGMGLWSPCAGAATPTTAFATPSG